MTKEKNKMSKNKFRKFINDISMYKPAIPEKYKKYFDVVTSLYLNRKIEKKTEVEKLLKTIIF